jgi:hypothetical protein
MINSPRFVARGSHVFCNQQQRCCLSKGLFLFLQVTLQPPYLAFLFLILPLEFSLVSHARSGVAIGILGCLPPSRQLFGVQPPLSAEGTQIGSAKTSSLDYGRQFFRGTPLFRCLAGSWHLLCFLLPAMPPAVEGMDVNPRGESDLCHALPSGRVHPLANLDL